MTRSFVTPECGFKLERFGFAFDDQLHLVPRLLEEDIEGEVSLEEVMGCGFGVCLSCVTEIEQEGRTHKQRICTEGPVFSIREVKW